MPSKALASIQATEADTTRAALHRLLHLVVERSPAEGRNDSHYPGLRYYRFSAPQSYQKSQMLMPGVVVVLQGAKTAQLARQTLSYDPMHCLVLGAATLCHGTVVRASACQPYLAIHLDLPPAILVKTVIAMAEQGWRPPASHADDHRVVPVELGVLSAFGRLLSACDSALDRATLAPLAVEEIIIRLMQSGAGGALRMTGSGRSAERIERSIRFIVAEHARALSVGELASQVAMSPSHYAHSFRQFAGVSPMQFLRDVRLEQARTLMLGAGMRAGEAAERAGFDSASHFNREFKRRFDATPAQYARHMAARSDTSAESGK